MNNQYIIDSLSAKTNNFYEFENNLVRVFNDKHTFIGQMYVNNLDKDNDIINNILDFELSLNNDIINEDYVINDFTKDKYSFLHNCYPVLINYNNLNFTCVQSAFEAQKESNKIARIHYTTVDGYTAMVLESTKLVKNWDTKQDMIMLELLKQKFNQEPFKSLLLNTEFKHINYCNTWHDNYWGICNCESCTDKNYNKLGKMLMQVREELYSNNEKE